MSVQQNESNYSYIIETMTPAGEHVMFWRIDQRVINVNHRHAVERAGGVVERHLHDLHHRTGLNYSCYSEGPKEEIDKGVHAQGIEVS